MSTGRCIDIELAPAMLADLRQRDAVLLAVKAVWTNSPLAAPVVWQAIEPSARMQLAWRDSTWAWASALPPADAPITMRTALDAHRGDRFELRAPGFGHVLQGGMPEAVELYNPTPCERCGGLAQWVNGAMAPICVAPLFSGNLVDMEPIETVALMFASRNWQVGRPIEVAPVDGLLLDAVDTATVQWTSHQRWAVRGAAAMPLAAATPLRPILAGAPAAEVFLRKAGVIQPLR